ncbi:MAG TPA: hypothetical protein PKB06_04380 [Actinotalea sp.]|nr:hypothetical protein [Actinotalea sp.]
MATEQELEEARRANAAALRAAFPNDFRPSEAARAAREEVVRIAHDPEAKAQLPQEEQLVGDEPRRPLYGRVMAKRGPFLVIQTPHGRAQAYVPNKGAELDEAARAALAALDLGDHVAVEGPLIGTRKGDAAVLVRAYRHVSKALAPPPDKWHGLKDVEKRYRERYVDLYANPEVADVFRARALIVAALREHLDAHGFIEVETPMLHSVRGGATAKPFSTHHNALDMPLYLRIAPELFHGATKVFYAPVDDFELSVTTVEDAASHPLPGRGPRVLVVLDGVLTLRGDAGGLTLGRGQSAFASVVDGTVEVAGSGTVVQATVP